MQRVQTWLRRCEELVESLGIFSTNEQVEDISTGDLKYLLVSAYLGNIQASYTDGTPAVRCAALQGALDSYTRFLNLCEQYDLVPLDVSSHNAVDAQTKREQKIRRYQQERLLKARLKAIQAGSCGNEAGAGSDKEDDKEDSEREAWLLSVQLALLNALEQISQLKQELEMVLYAQSIPEGLRQEKPAPPPADLLLELTKAASNLERQRQTIARDVFRPSHNLPTRTLRQQAEIEIQQANEQARRQEKAAKVRAELEADEDYMLQKQRNWDDWKDDHERGAGNDKLRPTA